MRFQRAAMVMSASWPLFLGIGIVLLAAMIISIVIYKTKAYKKLLFYEDDIKIEKRKSMAAQQRISMMANPYALSSLPNGPDNEDETST